jgi:Lrp/AsnC family transcriptional regulator, leucine-responsive regulatory protein
MSARRAHAVLPLPQIAARTEAICRVRLAPGKPSQVFEQWLSTLPAVSSAVCVTGDVDYELRLSCRDFAEFGEVLARLRCTGGAEVVSTALVLHEVVKPGLRRVPRPR